jgi:hypothetical protein
MTGYCYGQARLSKGRVVAGTDQNILSIIFTAGENPVEILSGRYQNGDASESYALAIVPPNTVSDGDTIDANTGYTVFNKALIGGTYTALVPGDIYEGVEARVFIGRNIVIPPWYSLIAWPITANTTNGLEIWVQGIDLVKP